MLFQVSPEKAVDAKSHKAERVLRAKWKREKG